LTVGFSWCLLTLEETRSLLLKPSAENAEKPVEKRELQFGSVNFVTGKSLDGHHGESSRQLDSPKEPNDLLLSNMLKKDNELKSVKLSNEHLPVVLQTPKENGTIDDSTHGSPHINGEEVKPDGIGLTSLHISQNEDGPSNQFSSSKLLNTERNGDYVDSSVFLANHDFQKTSNGPVMSSRNLLPRGLINSVNLCFLHATLQALLSCSPFVQLLQELRTRNIPKVYFLDAIVCIVSFCVYVNTTSAGIVYAMSMLSKYSLQYMPNLCPSCTLIF
jgi:ubiquitin carboxyl-terminal hydrolase 10